MRRAGRIGMWLLSWCFFPSLALASGGGIVGYSGLNQVSCSSCHSPASGSTAPTVTITGPSSLAGAATGSYVLTVSGGPGVRAGMNVAVDKAGAVLTPGNTASKNTAGELHHTTPAVFSGGQVQFPFTVTAPSTSGPVKIYAAAQSTNGSGSSGDREALTTFTINVTVANAPPTVSQAATATPTTVTGTTTQVAVLGADDGGEANLIYTWTANGPGQVTFAPNGTNAAKASTATFTKAGSYQLVATIRDAANQTVQSTRAVTVSQTVTQVAVSPPSAGVPVNGTAQFAASATDQFGDPVGSPPAFTWTVTGGGTVSSSGLFTAGAAAGGPFTLTAAASGKSGTASVNVLSGNPPVVLQPAAAAQHPVTGTAVALSAHATDDGGDANLTYTWTVASPPAPVTFSANGTYGARNTTATFTKVGTYSVTLTVKDKNNLTATSPLQVVVEPTLDKLEVVPALAKVAVNGSQPFVVDARDQFGAPYPTPVAWSVNGGGHINTSGIYRAAAAEGGPYEVLASTGNRQAAAQVEVAVGSPPRVLDLPVPAQVMGKTVALNAVAQDDGGESTLVYAWEGTGPAPVHFSASGTHGARNAVATFEAAGHYLLALTVTNVGGLSTTEIAEVEVVQTLTGLTVDPPAGRVAPSGTLLFSATPADQFGQPLTSGAQVEWQVAGGGQVGAEGLFTAGAATGGPWAVSANLQGFRARADVTVGDDGQDLNAPTVRLLVEEGTVLSGRARILAEAADAEGDLAEVRFVLGGQVVGRSAHPPFEVTVDTWSWFNGPYPLEVIATDLVGNDARHGPIEVRVENRSLVGAGGEVGCSAAPGTRGGASFHALVLLVLLALYRNVRIHATWRTCAQGTLARACSNFRHRARRAVRASAKGAFGLVERASVQRARTLARPVLKGTPGRSPRGKGGVTMSNRVTWFSAVVVALVANAAAAQTMTVEQRQRCATRLSAVLLGKSPTTTLLGSADPQASTDSMVATADFQERFARFANASFNPERGAEPAEDASFYLARHILQNNLPWKDLFVGKFRVVPGATATDPAQVQTDASGLGYFRSPVWMRRYAGNEAQGYRLVAAYRMLNNVLGIKLAAAVNTDGVDAVGRKSPACAGCHYDPVFGLDLVAKVLSRRSGPDASITYLPPNEGPQSLLGGIMVSNDSDFVNAMVSSTDFRFQSCRLAMQFLYGRAEVQCEGPVFDKCMTAFASTGRMQSAVAAIAKDPGFCQ
jgi:PKD repeat protein